MRLVARRMNRFLFSHYLLVACGLSLPVGARASVETVIFARHQPADLSGTYQGQAPPRDAARRVFTLDLAEDGTATFTTVYIGKDKATEQGRWRQTGNQVELTFDAMGANQPPRPIIFRHRDHQLSPIHWDASEWGRTGPPILHWSRAAHGASTTSQALQLHGFVRHGSETGGF
jgi:hypothetical protein